MFHVPSGFCKLWIFMAQRCDSTINESDFELCEELVKIKVRISKNTYNSACDNSTSFNNIRWSQLNISSRHKKKLSRHCEKPLPVKYKYKFQEKSGVTVRNEDCKERRKGEKERTVSSGVGLRARVCRVWWSARSALTRTNRLTG